MRNLPRWRAISGNKGIATARVRAGITVVETQIKTLLAVETDTQAQAEFAAADLAMEIKALFAACPNLCGFAVEGLSELHGDPDPNDGENRFAISQVSFGTPFSRDEAHQVCSLIVRVVSELVAEQPDAYELLRDRTFARMLH